MISILIQNIDVSSKADAQNNLSPSTVVKVTANKNSHYYSVCKTTQVGIYSISDLAELTGIKTHTLRVWEKRYGLLSPQRTEANIRFFEEADLQNLKSIISLYNNGVKISHIAEMTAEQRETEAIRTESCVEQQNAKLRSALMEMNATAIENILDTSIQKRGFESTLIRSIVPMLDELELMWLNQSIDEAHETCFKELVKRKTLREIDQLHHNCGGPRILMFLPKGNHQALRHLFMHYFLRKQGLCVTDMGCEINLDCACSALNKCEAECVLIVNEDPGHWQFGAFVKNLLSRISIPVIISGKAAEENWSQYGSQVIPIDSFEDTLHFVAQLKENLQQHLS